MSQVIKRSALVDVIDPQLLEELNIDADAQLEVKAEGGALVLRPIDRKAELRTVAKELLDVHQETFRKLAK